MHRGLIASVLALLIVLVSNAPAGATAPLLYLQVGDGPVQQFTNWNANGDLYFLTFTTSGSGWSFGGTIAANEADRYISYGISARNFAGADQSFKVTIVDPFLASFEGPNTVYASYSGSGTDVSGDGFAITPLDQASSLQTSWYNDRSVDVGVGVGQGFVDGPGIPGRSLSLGEYAAGPQAGPAPGILTDLDLVLGFNLSGHGDVATLNGFTSTEPAPVVPEPASVLLLGLGVAGTLILRRRRR